MYATNLVAGGQLAHVWQLDVPIVGPWLAMSRLGARGEPALALDLAADAIVQTGTVVMIVVGSLLQRRERVSVR